MDEKVGGKLVLNNGSKWQANPETTEGIQAMQKLTDDFIGRNDPDNKALSEALEKEINTVLQKCTMTGEAHTQLHNYLLPLKEKTEELKVKTGTQYYGNIQSYLDNYVNYFQ